MAKDAQVLVAGAGPTGLMLAAELALAGVDVMVVERRESQALAGSRAGGLHARTLEILDQRGVVDRFLAEGQVSRGVGFALISLDISDFPSRHACTLGLWQNHIERLLAGWLAELGVRIAYGQAVVGFEQDDSGVTLKLADGRTLLGDYLVGCDGGRSLIRKAAGIGFPGWDATTSNLIAEVEMTENPPLGMRQDPRGVHGLGRVDYKIVDGQVVYADTGPVRVMLTEARPSAEGDPTLDDLKAGLVEAYGTDFGAHSPIWISRFSDMCRQAETYRKGRVLLAGDAAHIHSPDGGMGLNTGVQDAVNLGWKLAQVVKGVSPDSLLDSYQAERHPVAARVLRKTMASVALRRQDERTVALRETVAEMLAMDAPRKQMAGFLSGLDIRYDLGEGHPLLGRRMPDLDLVASEGPIRIYSLLHAARPVLISFGEALNLGPSAHCVEIVEARYEGSWELPVIGAVVAPRAVLVRPDGHVAWVGDGGDAGLKEALALWFS